MVRPCHIKVLANSRYLTYRGLNYGLHGVETNQLGFILSKGLSSCLNLSDSPGRPFQLESPVGKRLVNLCNHSPETTLSLCLENREHGFYDHCQIPVVGDPSTADQIDNLPGGISINIPEGTALQHQLLPSSAAILSSYNRGTVQAPFIMDPVCAAHAHRPPGGTLRLLLPLSDRHHARSVYFAYHA